MRSLKEWLALQEAVHVRSIDLGLERVAHVAHALGIDKPKYRVITVAGTNGKGSTVAYLESILRRAGVRVGAFTSPHIVRYNERIRVGGEEASDAELVEAFERIEAARGSTTLTFFEFNALAALLVFAAREVEVAILEVGLGGRLDATNIVDADVAVVCSVGFDHRDWLGDTLDAIGAEKAGIFRPGRPAVLGTADMPASVYRTIESLGARPVVAERDFHWKITGSQWSYSSPRLELSCLSPPSLAGDIQYRNAATAIAALEALGLLKALDADNVSEALRDVKLSGRFQILPGAVEWIIDVSHNEPAARVLADNLRARSSSGRTYAVTSILRDKDVPAIGRVLEGLIDCWILCTLTESRGSTSEELAQRLPAGSAEVVQAPSVEAGCEMARGRAVPGDRVLVFGSFATVAAALQWLGLYSKKT